MPPTPKLLAFDALLARRGQAQAKGQTVVHCHGCFDIVHPGHIHHLQFARSLGDVLLVSVSADSQVNKGASRPLIPDELRTASLAALECVDWVYLNPDPTATQLLDQLRPDIYVKGQEYEQSQDPRFLAERDAVTRHGGRVVFSSGDIVYSSTALIGAGLSAAGTTAPMFDDEKLTRLCRRHNITATSLSSRLHSVRGMPIVVVGDYILDRYHFCDATGIAGESPMMSLRELETRAFDGGAAVVALHLAGLGAKPTLVTAMAHDDDARDAAWRLRQAGVTVRALPRPRATVQKHRYLVDTNKLIKIDQGSAVPLDSTAEAAVAEQIAAATENAAACIFTDFGYGLITAGLLQRIMPDLRKRVGTLTADVSGMQTNLLMFRDVDLLCPTERELRQTLHDFSSGLGNVVARLLQTTGAHQAIVTLGKQGLIGCDWPAATPAESDHRLRSEYVPALCKTAIDPMGCGDALLAAASAALAAGASLPEAALLGSLAAAQELNQLGNVPLNIDDLHTTISRLSWLTQQRAAA
jgi:rfaE bifunctional protein kinase chain/domain/rfaE bifunctional protein nucleotidyltransferase chain/domain